MKPLAALASLALAAAPAAAADLFGGVYKHDVRLFTKQVDEPGVDFELGYRFDSILSLGPLGGLQPYVLGSLNSRGKTDFAAAGLALKFGGPVYVRPGIGLAIHDEKIKRFVGSTRVDLGSRILFEPELAVGWQVLPRIALEASYTHLSHARIFSKQNPGLDMLGLRVNLHLP